MPLGPIGLLIESIVWHGMKIDGSLRLWQHKEEPLDILKVPYQNLKPLVLGAAARARNRAEWRRGASTKRARSPIEIDNDISQVAGALDEEEKGIIRIVMMGGSQAKKEVATYNQDVEGVCNYCFEADSTVDHVRWACKHFDPI